MGVKYDNSTSSCADFTADCSALRTQSACDARRIQDIKSCPGKNDCFVTACDHGAYSQMQENNQGCWCVDRQGNEINGSRIEGSRSICSNKDCSELGSPEIMLGHHKVDVKALVHRAILYLLAAIFFGGPILGGFYLAVFNAIKSNSPIKFRDFFRCFCCRYYWKLLALSFVLRVLQAVLYLLILPGMWWTLATVFAIPAHKEHSFLGVCGSIRISMLVVHRHFCSMICFVLLLTLLQIAGFLCLIVGLLYTIPLAFVAFCYCYHDLIGIVPEVVPMAVPVDTPVTMHM